MPQVRQQRTACDRCYKLKERCERPSNLSACTRCARLERNCSTVRPLRWPGRKCRQDDRSSRNLAWLSRSGAPPSDHIVSMPSNDIGVSSEERALLTALLRQPNALSNHVVSSSFHDLEQQSLAALLPSGLPILKDAYLAYASLLASSDTKNGETNTNSSLRRASSAMMTLRSFGVSSLEDATLCLTLGAALATFVYAVIGMGVSDICSHCLSAVSPFVDTTMLDTGLGSRLILLALLDTMDAIVYRRKPTLRLQTQHAKYVDRFLGLSSGLLPYYYDICAISHSLDNTTDLNALRKLHWQLDEINKFLISWQPNQPDNFINEFGTAEVVHILAQAKIYRLGALLLAHRLRHPFGQEDSQANIWSREIIAELELARQTTKTPTRFVTLPFLTAAVEVQDPVSRIRVLEAVNEYVDQFSPAVQKAARHFLSQVWRERQNHSNYSWLDSVHKPCIVVDHIEKQNCLQPSTSIIT